MRPMSATEALKNANVFHPSRFEPARARNDSVAKIVSHTQRERSNSVKRKASAEIANENPKKTNVDIRPSVDLQKLESMDNKIKMLRGICYKLNEDAPKLKVDIGLENVIRSMCEFVDVSASIL
jgi:hypothetical protein